MKKAKELVSYIVFGVLTTVVSWGTYTLFVNINISVFWSNVLSWICAIAFAYFTNKLWVFESKSWKLKLVIKEVISFVGSRALTGAFEIAFVPILASIGFDNLFAFVGIKIEGIYSKVFVSVVVVILNYFFSKLLVFKKKDK